MNTISTAAAQPSETLRHHGEDDPTPALVLVPPTVLDDWSEYVLTHTSRGDPFITTEITGC